MTQSLRNGIDIGNGIGVGIGNGIGVAFTVGLSIVVHTAGCSAPTLPQRYEKAQKLELTGNLHQALALYDRVFRTAKKPAHRALAGIRKAKILVELKRYREAIRVYRAVAEGPGQRKRIGARALYRAGVLWIDKLGKIRRARRVFMEIIELYPDKVAADDALERIVRIYRANQRIPQLLSYLKERYHRFSRADIADNLLWAAAQVYEKDLKDYPSAAMLYERVVKHRPDGPLFDDANFHAAALYRKMGKPLRAIVCYHRILATKSDAWVVGSWNSVYLDNAQLETGMTYLEDLRNPAKAISAFRTLINDFKSSPLRDDGLWWIALTELRRGKIKRAMAAHAELRKKFSDSRYAREREPLRAWAPVAAALHRRDKTALCAAIARHAAAHRRTWFRKRRKKLIKKWGCP